MTKESRDCAVWKYMDRGAEGVEWAAKQKTTGRRGRSGDPGSARRLKERLADGGGSDKTRLILGLSQSQPCSL